MKTFVESFGRAPVALFAIAILSAVGIAATHSAEPPRADLVVAVFSPSHLEAYERVIPAFEREHGVKVQVELTDWHALESRLQNAMLSGTEVPDLVELIEGSLGFFTRGPAEDTGFLALEKFIARDGLDQELVTSRLSLWSSQGHVYALPHDVHPVMLTYRRDLIAELGIDVDKLDTWDAFVAMGHEVRKDKNGDGKPDHYALDLPMIGNNGLWTLMLQRGAQFFDAEGNVAFDSEETVQTIRWYLEQSFGPKAIATDCGWGQPLMKAMTDGLALFYLTPDWRTYTIKKEIPNMAGKLAVMPLPAFSPGGRRTSVWGGSGMAISKQVKNPELAWKLVKHLYMDRSQLGERFRSTHIIPPVRDALSLPALAEPVPFYAGQPLGLEFAKLAPQVPPFYSSPVHRVALSKVDQAFARSAAYYKSHGEQGLDEHIRAEVAEAAAYVRRASERVARLREAK